MPRGFSPIDIKVAIAKPPIRPDFQFNKLAEVVRIELKQIGQDRLLLQQGGNDFDIWPGLLWVFIFILGSIQSIPRRTGAISCKAQQ